MNCWIVSEWKLRATLPTFGTFTSLLALSAAAAGVSSSVWPQQPCVVHLGPSQILKFHIVHRGQEASFLRILFPLPRYRSDFNESLWSSLSELKLALDDCWQEISALLIDFEWLNAKLSNKIWGKCHMPQVSGYPGTTTCNILGHLQRKPGYSWSTKLIALRARIQLLRLSQEESKYSNVLLFASAWCSTLLASFVHL